MTNMADENTITQPSDPVEQRINALVEQGMADPSLIPDKYRDPDPEVTKRKFKEGLGEFYKDYTQTKQRLKEIEASGKTVSQTEQPATPAAPADPNATLGIPEPSKPSDLWTRVEQAVGQSGDLPEDLRGELTKLGIPATVIDTTVNGYKIQRQTILNEASTLVGGAESLKAVQQWAAQHLDPQERQIADAALRSPAWKTTLLGLKARMDADRVTKGEPQSTPQGTPNYGSSGLKPYASQQQVIDDMNSREYKTNPDFQRAVQERIWLTQQRERQRR